MSKHDNTLPTKTSFFISSARKIESPQEFKINLFASSCFTADDSYIKIIWLHVVVFSEHDILHF